MLRTAPVLVLEGLFGVRNETDASHMEKKCRRCCAGLRSKLKGTRVGARCGSERAHGFSGEIRILLLRGAGRKEEGLGQN